MPPPSQWYVSPPNISGDLWRTLDTLRNETGTLRGSIEQLEVLSGLAPGERIIVSDYTSLDQADRIVFTR